MIRRNVAYEQNEQRMIATISNAGAFLDRPFTSMLFDTLRLPLSKKQEECLPRLATSKIHRVEIRIELKQGPISQVAMFLRRKPSSLLY